MAMYGQKGRDLLLELKRSDWLPPYNGELCTEILEEIALHFDELQAQISQRKATHGSTFFLIIARHGHSSKQTLLISLSCIAIANTAKRKSIPDYEHFNSAQLANVTAEVGSGLFAAL